MMVDRTSCPRGPRAGSGPVASTGSSSQPLPLALILLSISLVLTSPALAEPPVHFDAGRMMDVGRAFKDLLFADLDGDGHLDLLLTFDSPDVLEIRLGDGSGDFEIPPSSSRALPYPDTVRNALLVTDLTGDGHADIVFTAYDDNAILLYRGDGTGAFPDPSEVFFTALDGPVSPDAVDVDGDGDLDLVLLGIRSDEAAIVRCGGEAGLLSEELFGEFAGGQVNYLGTGHFDDDGALDFAIASASFGKLAEGYVNIVLGDGNGGASQTRTVLDSAPPWGMEVVDVDDDGNLDLLVLGFSPNGTIKTFLGDGLGGFTRVSSGGFKAFHETLNVRDLDGDGHLDVIGSNTSVVSCRFGDGTGSFQATEAFGSVGRDLRVHDLDEDGALDIVVGNHLEGLLNVHRGRGDGTVTTLSHSIPVVRQTGSLASGDFDEDGIPDLLAGSPSRQGCGGGPGVSILLSAPEGGFRSITNVSAPRTSHILVDDFTGDGHLDFIVGCRWYGGDGQGGFTHLGPLLTLPQERRVASSTSADLDGDGHTDLAFGTTGSSGVLRAVLLVLGNGDGTFGPQEEFFNDRDPNAGEFGLASADWDEDGHVDLLFTGTSDLHHYFGVSFGDGSGTFAPPDLLRTDLEPDPRSLVVADFNNDTHPDVAFAHGRNTFFLGSTGVSVILGSGQRSAATPLRYITGAPRRSVTPLDLDDDGNLDLVVTAFEDRDEIVLLRGDGTGQFSVMDRLAAGPNPDGAILLDYDRDGKRDLLVAHDVEIDNAGIDEGRVSVLLDRTREIGARRGNVNASAGPVTDVLLVNGSPGSGLERRVRVPARSPIEVALQAAVAGPVAEVEYLLWVWRGSDATATDLTIQGELYGTTVLPTPFDQEIGPQPKICMRSGGIMNIGCRGVDERTGPDFAPWTSTKASGLNTPRTLTVQAFVRDDSATNAFGFSITNAVVVEIFAP